MEWVGTGGREPGRKGAGDGRREGGKWETRGDGNREKLRKCRNIFLIFRNRNGAERREPLRKGAGSRRKSYGKRERKIREVRVSDPGNIGYIMLGKITFSSETEFLFGQIGIAVRHVE